MKRVYKHLLEPEKYPEFEKRAAKAITRSALGGEIQFTSLRELPLKGENYFEIANQVDSRKESTPIKGFKICDLEKFVSMYADHFKLGKILWPEYPVLFTENFNELVDYCRKNGLYVFDFWGFIPGSKPAESRWGEYKIPKVVDKYMKESLGDHFLGYDSGEQDGRYVSDYCNYHSPLIDSRKSQYKNYQSHFEKINDNMLNHTVTLAGLTFLHYFAKEGNSIMLGAETAQALPNNNMWFAFIRGASKQYGLLNYGCVSIFNRWGYKDYNTYVDTCDDSSIGYSHDPMSGTSLSLLRRLMYNQYMYNCDALGYEGNWLAISPAKPEDKTDDKNFIIGDQKYSITPIGEIQQKCGEFVRKHGTPGVMYTPLAIIADFHSGWVPPRHLYATSTGDVFKVWGTLPYNTGDYQLDCLFSTLFPHYERSGFYRDESGFETATPYGEIADVLLSDVRLPILNRYSAAIVLNDTEMTLELFKKLKGFVSNGGKLLVFEGLVNSGLEIASYDDDYCKMFGVGEDTDAPSRNINFGKGTVTVVQSESGLTKIEGAPIYETGLNADLAHHYEFSASTKKILDSFISPLEIIRPTNSELQYCLNIKGENEYILYVANNTLSTETFDIEACEGKITEIVPMPLFDNVCHLPEFLPKGFSDINQPTFKDGKYTIAAGDCLFFTVKTEGIQLSELEESYPESAGENLYLFKGYSGQSAKDFLLEHPTFSHSFEGMMIPAEYFERLSETAAKKEAHYFKLQNVKIGVDFTRLLNDYPDMSIIGNYKTRTAETIERIERTVRLASEYGCRFALFSCTQNAEIHWSREDSLGGMIQSFERIKSICNKYGVECMLQNRHIDISSEEQYNIARKSGIKPAYNTVFAECAAVARKNKDEAVIMAGDCALLMLAAPYCDEYGQLYKMQKPVALCEREDIRAKAKSYYLTAKEKGMPVVLAADFADWNEVVAELDFLK